MLLLVLTTLLLPLPAGCWLHAVGLGGGQWETFGFGGMNRRDDIVRSASCSVLPCSLPEFGQTDTYPFPDLTSQITSHRSHPSITPLTASLPHPTLPLTTPNPCHVSQLAAAPPRISLLTSLTPLAHHYPTHRTPPSHLSPLPTAPNPIVLPRISSLAPSRCHHGHAHTRSTNTSTGSSDASARC